MAEAVRDIAALAPRTRVLLAVILAFGAAGTRHPAMVPILLALALIIVALARPPSGFGRKLRAPGLLALGIVAFLPLFGAGPALIQLGPLSYCADTAATASLIAARLLAIVAMVLALLSGLPDLHLIAGLRGLRVPILLCDLALLTLRYQHDLRVELGRARLARDLRGGRNGWRALPDFGAMLAVLILRTLRRSERVWAAMRARGYHNGLGADNVPLRVADFGAITLAGLAALSLIGLNP